MDVISYKGVACRPGTYRVKGEDRPALYCVSAPDRETLYGAGFTETHMGGPWVRILTEEEYGEVLKENGLRKAWEITGIRISSRSDADVYYGDRTVRIPGEAMTDWFLADPYEMFWLEKEDREIWPWKLPGEKRRNILSEEESAAVMDTVTLYFRNRKHPVIFLTREIENRAFELAAMVRERRMSGWKAASALKKEFPDLPDRFCRTMITDALAGVRWYG